MMSIFSDMVEDTIGGVLGELFNCGAFFCRIFNSFGSCIEKIRRNKYRTQLEEMSFYGEGTDCVFFFFF